MENTQTVNVEVFTNLKLAVSINTTCNEEQVDTKIAELQKKLDTHLTAILTMITDDGEIITPYIHDVSVGTHEWIVEDK